MKIYVLFYFEDTNDLTIIIKPRLQLVALYKSLTLIVTSSLCSKCNIGHRFSWNKCQLNFQVTSNPNEIILLDKETQN